MCLAMRRDFWWREREWRWWREREKRACDDKREERRRWWWWKREQTVVVRVAICGGLRVERAAIIVVFVVVSSIMGSCATEKERGHFQVVKCVGKSVSNYVVGLLRKVNLTKTICFCDSQVVCI